VSRYTYILTKNDDNLRQLVTSIPNLAKDHVSRLLTDLETLDRLKTPIDGIILLGYNGHYDDLGKSPYTFSHGPDGRIYDLNEVREELTGFGHFDGMVYRFTSRDSPLVQLIHKV
jgi:hypothetical protein